MTTTIRARRKRPDFGTKPERPTQMDPAEFEAIRLVLGKDGEPYPRSWLADALGVNVRQVYRWGQPSDDPEHNRIQGPVASWMRFWMERGFVVG